MYVVFNGLYLVAVQKQIFSNLFFYVGTKHMARLRNAVVFRILWAKVSHRL